MVVEDAALDIAVLLGLARNGVVVVVFADHEIIDGVINTIVDTFVCSRSELAHISPDRAIQPTKVFGEDVVAAGVAALLFGGRGYFESIIAMLVAEI